MEDYRELALRIRRDAKRVSQDAEQFRPVSRQTCFNLLSVERLMKEAADLLVYTHNRIEAGSR